MFEKDKLTVATLVTTRILVDNDLLPGEDVSYGFLGKVHPDPGISRRPAVLRAFTPSTRRRLHQRMSWLVSLSEFEAVRPPSRANRDAHRGNMGPSRTPRGPLAEDQSPGRPQAVHPASGDAMHSDSDDWLAARLGANTKALEVGSKVPGLDWQKSALGAGYFDGATPEVAKFPGDWQKNLSPFDRIGVRRMPWRVGSATSWARCRLSVFIELQRDVVSDGVSLKARSTSNKRPSTCPRRTRNRSPQTPTFFVFFPGRRPHAVGRRSRKRIGAFPKPRARSATSPWARGRRKPAEAIVERYAKNGGWVMLQNCHLMSSWVSLFGTIVGGRPGGRAC